MDKIEKRYYDLVEMVSEIFLLFEFMYFCRMFFLGIYVIWLSMEIIEFIN